jgi:hypothetical protein
LGGGHLEAQCPYTILETGTGHRDHKKKRAARALG